MLKALVNKQLSELGAVMFRGSKKTGKSSAGLKILYVALYLMMLVGMYYLMLLFAEIFKGGDAWAYFSMTAVAVVLVGILGSIFMVQSMLYDAKDNDSLTAMPIPHRYIIISRMVPLYIMCLVIESMIIIPAYFAFPMTVMRGVMLPVTLIFLPLGSLAVCAAVGLPFSILLARSRFKNIILTLLSVLLLLGTLYIRVQSNQIFTSMLEQGDKVASAITEYLAPIRFIGEGMAGNAGYAVMTSLICAVLFSAVVLILSKCFLSVAGVGAGVRAKRFSSGAMKSRSITRALLTKELGRLSSSYIYLINSTIGSLLLIIAVVMMLINRQSLASAIAGVLPKELYTAVIVGAVCMGVSMNTVSAPSISLEGRSIDIMKSLPIPEGKLLMGKLLLHVAVTSPVALVSSVVLAMTLNAGSMVPAIVIPQLYIVISAALGLVFNLRFVNLTWTSETVAVKQGVAVLFAMLSNLVLAVVASGICIITWIAAIPVLGITAVLLVRYLKGGGARRFMKL